MTLKRTKGFPSWNLRWRGLRFIKRPENRREQGFLSKGDVISGYSAAVAAINGGRKAAASIHSLLYGHLPEYPSNPITRQSILQGVNHLEGVQISPRNIMPVADISNRGNEELFKGFSDETAVKEAERCLRCGLICYDDPNWRK